MRTALFALSALAMSAGAHAATEDFVVEHADLNLANAKDQKTLSKRIDSAARAYCQKGSIRTGTRITSRESQECYRQARAAANEQMAVLIENEVQQNGG